MRIAAVSDIHNEKQAVFLLKDWLKEKAVDAVIVAGDITSHGNAADAEEIIKELRQIARVFAVPGNLDTKEVTEFLEKKGVNLHNKSLVFDEYKIAGFGGGLKGNPGQTNFSEKEIEKSLESLLAGDCSKTILVTHLPPFGTSLDLAGGARHIGSKAIMKIIEKKQPLLHICGHAHDSAGEEIFGGTLSANVAALKDGKAALIDFNGKNKIERIELYG